MQACILVGGLGTRLRSLLPDLPKPMAPIDGVPFLHHVVAHLRHCGIKDIIMLTGFKHEAIEEYFGSRYLGCSISYSHEHTPLGTAGAVRLALDQIASEQFLLINGDTYFPADLGLLMDFHEAKKAQCSIGLKILTDCSRYGTVELGDNYCVSRFAEKVTSRHEGYINAGVYVVNRELVAKAEAGRTLSMERDVLPSASRVYALPLAAPFIDIGVPEDYVRATTVIEGGNATLRRALFAVPELISRRQLNDVSQSVDPLLTHGAVAVCAAANGAGHDVVLISNQPDVAMGEASVDDIDALHSCIMCGLQRYGISIAGYLFCPYDPHGINRDYARPSPLRMPEAGMLLLAADRWGLNLRQSFVIGVHEHNRIRLPYLRSYLTRSHNYTEMESCDFDDFEDVRQLFHPAKIQ